MWLNRLVNGWKNLIAITLVVGGITIAGWLGLFKTGSRQDSSTNVPSAMAKGTAPGVSQRELTEASDALERASSDIDAAELSVSRYEQQIETLRSSGDDEVTKQISVLDKSPRVPQDEIEQTRTSLEKYRDLLGQRIGSSSPQPLSAPEQAQLRRISRVAQLAKTQWASAVSRSSNLVRSSGGEVSLPESVESMTEQTVPPEALRILAPFTELSYQQPYMSGASVKFKKTLDKSPISISALQSAGALTPDMKGLQVLAKIGSDHDIGENRWALRPYPSMWSDADQEMLQEAQHYLINMGPELVRQGYLSQ